MKIVAVLMGLWIGSVGAVDKSDEKPTAEVAILAGGCFWCMQKPYDKTPGVVSTEVGYTGGTLENPTYEQVSKGDTGHYEAIRIEYDPKQISYDEILQIFWRNIDPYDASGQFCDHGDQYRAVIFPMNAAQKEAAVVSKSALEKQYKKPVVTEIVAAGDWYPAEEYHQHYYKKNPIRYRFYRTTCGRDARLRDIWG